MNLLNHYEEDSFLENTERRINRSKDDNFEENKKVSENQYDIKKYIKKEKKKEDKKDSKKPIKNEIKTDMKKFTKKEIENNTKADFKEYKNDTKNEKNFENIQHINHSDQLLNYRKSILNKDYLDAQNKNSIPAVDKQIIHKSIDDEPTNEEHQKSDKIIKSFLDIKKNASKLKKNLEPDIYEKSKTLKSDNNSDSNIKENKKNFMRKSTIYSNIKISDLKKIRKMNSINPTSNLIAKIHEELKFDVNDGSEKSKKSYNIRNLESRNQNFYKEDAKNIKKLEPLLSTLGKSLKVESFINNFSNALLLEANFLSSTSEKVINSIENIEKKSIIYEICKCLRNNKPDSINSNSIDKNPKKSNPEEMCQNAVKTNKTELKEIIFSFFRNEIVPETIKLEEPEKYKWKFDKDEMINFYIENKEIDEEMFNRMNMKNKFLQESDSLRQLKNKYFSESKNFCGNAHTIGQMRQNKIKNYHRLDMNELNLLKGSFNNTEKPKIQRILSYHDLCKKKIINN